MDTNQEGTSFLTNEQMTNLLKDGVQADPIKGEATFLEKLQD